MLLKEMACTGQLGIHKIIQREQFNTLQNSPNRGSVKQTFSSNIKSPSKMSIGIQSYDNNLSPRRFMRGGISKHRFSNQQLTQMAAE